MENMLNKLVHMLSARRHNAVNKRVAALLVALSLMSGMLPTFAPSAAATDGKPAPVLLDFSQLKSAKDSANNNKWTITEYGNANFTINMAKSYHASHRVFYGSANGGFSAPHIDVGTPDVSWLKMPDRRLTIDFNVPASGIYTIDLTGGKWYAGGIADVFIDDQYLGDYDFCNYDESNTLPRTMGEKKVLRTVALTGGEHEISLRTRGGGMFNYTYLIPYQIHMTPAEELAQIDQVIGSVEKESMDVAESQTLTGRVQMTDGASYSFGYTDDGQEKQDEIVTVESSDPATVEVSAVSLREAGKAGEFSAQLTAKAVGSANITVSVRLGAGEAKTTVVPITVAGGEAEPTPVLLDFSQLKSAQDSANDNRWTITEYGNANFTIDMAKSYHASHRVFYGSANGGFSAPHIDVGTPDVSWLTTPNRRLTIDFDVPASGIYTIDLTGGKWYAGGIADVFIDDQYLGDYDFCNYDESNTLPRSMGEKKVLRTVALTGGEHEISLRTRGGSVFRNAYLIPYQIHLTPAAELAQIDQVVGSVEKENMDVAESQSLIGRVQMTDGTSYSFGYTDDGQEKQDEIVTVESSDPATVEVSAVSLREAGKSGEFSAQLTAKAAGSANITVSVRLGTGEAKTTVIPITVAGGEAEPKPVLLDFSQLKTSRVDGIWTVTEYGNAHFTIDADKSYHSSYRMYSGSAHGGFAALHAEAGAPDVSWLTTPNRRLTIDFTVPASGIYTIDLTGGKWYAGGIADVFIDDQYLGDYDFCNYDESNTLPRSMGEKKALRTVALTAGEHEISLRTRGGSVFRLTYFIPYQINLTPATGLAEADRVIGTIERESMAIDETQTLTGKVQMTDGTSYGFGFTDDGQEKQGETVTVESSDPSVVEVSAVSLREAGKAGEFSAQLTAKAAGNANITVSVRLGDREPKTTVVPVSVAGEDQLESVRLSIDKASIYEDEVTGVSMEALMSISGAASEDQLRQMGATITYLSRNEQIAVIDPESGEITGVSAGTVELAVAVSLNGVEKTGVAELTVVESPEPAQLLLDFSQLKSAQDSANNNKWTITEYGNANFTIDMAKSYHASHRVYSGASFGGFSAPHIEIGPQDMSWLKDQSRRLTIDFTVPASGIYTIDLTGGKWYAGGIADVFIDGQYLGDYDFCNYDESNALPRSMGEKKILKTVSLRAGEHEISLRTRGGSVFRNAYLIPYQIHLTPAAEPAEIMQVVGAVEHETMATGESQMFTGGVRMTDGASYSFGYTDDGQENPDEAVAVESSDPAVVEVSAVSLREAGKAGEFSVQLTAKSMGSVNLTVSVRLCDGQEKTTVIPLTVGAETTLERVDLTLSKNQVYVGNTVQASAKAYLSNQTESQSVRFTYESSAPEIAAVDAESGLVTGLRAGSASIKVTAWRGQERVEASETLTVLVNSLKSISFAETSMTMLLGDSIALSASGMRADGTPANLSEYTLSYQSSDASIVAVDGSGKLTAHALGQAVITLTATKGEEQARASIDVTVSETAEGFHLKFSAVDTNKDSGKFEIAAYNDAGFTVDPDKSNNSSHRIFAVGTAGSMRSLHVEMGPSTANWMGSNAENMKYRFTVRFKVPYSANYDISFQGCVWYAGCLADIFVDDTYLGDYNFYDGDESFTSVREYGENKQLNSVYLTAGTHEVSFRTRGSGKFSTEYLILHEMTFTPTEKPLTLSHIEATIPEKLIMGEEIQIPMTAWRACDTKYHSGVTDAGGFDTENGFSCESSQENVLKLEGFENHVLGQSGTALIRLVPQAAGMATVTIRVHAGGESKSVSFPVEVTNEKLAATSARTAKERVGVGDRVQIIPLHILDSGRTTDTPSIVTSYESLTPNLARVEEDYLVALGEGTARIKVTARFGGVSVEYILEVPILSLYMTDLSITAGGSDYVKLNGEKTPLFVTPIDNTGQAMDASGAEITWQALTPDILSIDGDGFLSAHKQGEGRVSATVSLNGDTLTKEATIRTIVGKSEPTLVSMEKRQNAIENGSRYPWARAEIDTYVKTAEEFVQKEDALWNMVVSEGIPRSMVVGIESDPKLYYCRYCDTDLLAKYGAYAFRCDPWGNPWKVQCPDCRRWFPSNDFGGFYQLGLNEYGEFSLDRAKARNEELVAAGQDGYLKNILYPESGTKFGDANWGVDDGFGYLPGRAIPNGKPERHTYIGYYLHWGIWRRNGANTGLIYTALKNLAHAYAYTGEAKYGRVGAILLDRVADVYPGFELLQYKDITWNSHGNTGRGRIVGNIWENSLVIEFATDYDLLFPAFDDPYVIQYLNNKSKQVKMRHSKENATQIRNNIEDGILRTIYEGVQDSSISGNFGYPQRSIATAAVALDSMPESGEWLEWMMAPGIRNDVPCTGGNVASQLVDIVDRDGQGNEASEYNIGWINSMLTIADVLNGYEKYPAADLYQHPKLRNMVDSNKKMIASRYYTPQIGDSASTASSGLWMNTQIAKRGFEHYGDPVFAQYLYELNGQSAGGLRDEITAENPEQLALDVQQVIDRYGQLNPPSDIMTGFGYAIIKDGAQYESAADLTSYNNQRNFWMYFGKNDGHGDRDTLNLGLDAFGLNMTPDLGYPETTGPQPNRLQWTKNTLSHNTVVVGLERQQAIGTGTVGDPLHFDDAGAVKLMDVEANKVYPETDSYRRTVVMVQVSDEVSYGVDFFRVIGGGDHLYSFHSQSDEIGETTGLELVKQADAQGNFVGTYAGADVPYGQDPNTITDSYNYTTLYPRGFTWLDQVSRAKKPEDTFAVDFKVKDFKKVAGRVPDDMHLRLTMLNNAQNTVSEVAIANGYPPNKAENSAIPNLKYMLVRRTGEDLDSLFTSVIEPYHGERFLKAMENVTVTRKDTGEEMRTNDVRAVKVTHHSGRVDYIVYARDNTVLYQIDGQFDFRGFVGVYSLGRDGQPLYRYLNDGDVLGEESYGPGAVTGAVLDFTKELSMENSVRVSVDQDVEPSIFTGKMIRIENDGVENGCYRIQGAEKQADGSYTLDLGTISPIRSYQSGSDLSRGFTYNFAQGASFRIPLSYLQDDSPVFEPVAERRVAAGKPIQTVVSATSPLDLPLTYSGTILPRGAQFDPAARTVHWTPGTDQLGRHHLAVEVSDGVRSAVCHFYITVYNASSPSPPSSRPPDEGEEVVKPPVDPPKEDGETGDERFIDLGGYGWAKEAIDALAEQGIIQGTSENTYSPGKSITRADFAILLVRAFGLAGEAEKSFADVAPGAYYAREVSIAYANGIINGVGGGRFEPEAAITRQDALVILYRALQMAGTELSEADEAAISKFADEGQISQYAREAAGVLAASGLVQGDNGYFRPGAQITRAEAAVLLYRAVGKENQEKEETI